MLDKSCTCKFRVWTVLVFLCPESVQMHEVGLGGPESYQTLDLRVQSQDRVCTLDPEFEQGLDLEVQSLDKLYILEDVGLSLLTKFVSLQSLDFTSNPCPTNH